MMGQQSREPPHVVEAAPAKTSKGGRPRCPVSSAEVRRLRGQGQSWRQISRTLHIGTATAMRLCRLDTVPNPSQNSEVRVERR